MSQPTVHFEPSRVAYWFGEIMKLPHGSGKEQPLRESLYQWLTDTIGIPAAQIFYRRDATAPGERVIRVSRPGRSGELKPVVLQAHLDMVVVTNPKDRDPFPLVPHLQSPSWLKALGNGSTPDMPIGSTLGADDGIGVATALALLEDSDLRDYPLECLFTVEEETGMGGALQFDTSLLTGRSYINLDEERSGTITYGSAGGFGTTYRGTLLREPQSLNSTTVTLVVGGLRGGHSGVDIAKGRPSALRLLTECLHRMNGRVNHGSLAAAASPNAFDYRLVSFARTDSVKSNAIPTEATATVALNAGDASAFVQSTRQWFAAIQTIYGASEPNLRLECSTAGAAETGQSPLAAHATDNLLCLLQLIPHGVLGVVPGCVPSVVETSSNLYDIRLTDTTVELLTLTRTSNPALLGTLLCHDETPLATMFKSLGALYSFDVETGSNWYPAWPPNPESPLLNKARDAFASVYGKDCETAVIHAGLECGWIVSRYSDMDCIAIGPTVENPHTTDERLDIATVAPFYQALKTLLKNLFT